MSVAVANNTALDFSSSSTSYAGTLAQRRLYWAVWASLRRYFNAVIDGRSDASEHYNHIHVDLSCGSVPPPSVPWGTYSDDTLIIQHLCNDFNSAGLGTDGKWGANTQAGWNSLLTKLDMQCINPLTSASSWKTFLAYIIMHGVANKSAGYWDYVCSEVS